MSLPISAVTEVKNRYVNNSQKRFGEALIPNLRGWLDECRSVAKSVQHFEWYSIFQCHSGY